jgi:hypothetical protein
VVWMNYQKDMMSDTLVIGVKDIVPAEGDVMVLQGIPRGQAPPASAISLYKEAVEVFRTCARPKGKISKISREDFYDVYKGESLNEEITPVFEVASRADSLALFAVTVGQAVHDRIGGLFQIKELALASMLDSVASAGVEKAADIVEVRFLELLKSTGAEKGAVVMRYSPGYCGWHVSGQKKLFDYLKPQDIGISLRDSYMMEPLKSVSGVLLAGKKEIHIIEDNYPFCSQCETHSCQERVRLLLQGEVGTA